MHDLPPAPGRWSPGRGPARGLARLAAVLPVTIPLVLLVATGLAGIDFGEHWDEFRHFDEVRRTVETGVILPDFYQHPSLSYLLTLAGVVPDVMRAVGSGSRSVDEVRERIRPVLWSHGYHMRVRKIFLFITALTVLWVYLLVLAWRGWGEALLAASFLGFSWEVGYHARWIAPDGIMMQFVALALLGAIMSRIRPPGRGWLRLAAVAAGFACGAKYPAGLILVLVLGAACASRDRLGLRRGLLSLLAELVFLFAVSYLFTTPGTLIEPVKFVSNLSATRSHYGTSHGAAPGYNVMPGLEHVWRVLVYLALALFSWYGIIAAAAFGLALVGLAALWKESPRLVLLVLSFPLVFVFFYSGYKVCIVRNYLALAPFLAVFAARGTAFLVERARHRLARGLVIAAVAAMFAVNGVWVVRAAASIPGRSPDRFIRQVAAYIDSHPEKKFHLSQWVWERLAALDDKERPNATRERTLAAAEAIFYAREGMSQNDWLANRRRLVKTWFGPWEVNFNYYPTWGEDRILVMPMERALRLGELCSYWRASVNARDLDGIVP